MSNEVKIVWDQLIAFDRAVVANRPDILIHDKKRKKAYIIDISCPCDTNVKKKESEKILEYSGLKTELSRMWGCQVEVIPVVIGGLGAVKKNFRGHLKKIPGIPSAILCQKAAIIGSKKILRKFLQRP